MMINSILWQTEALDKMSHLINELFPNSKITISGSVLTPSELDLYSDVDIEITLSTNIPIDISNFLNTAAKHFSPVFGYELISHSRKDAVRICFENGMRFDLVFLYESEKLPTTQEICKIDNVANKFWFYASLILVKLGRRDNLIAAHLALELCQLIIVIQMIARDNKKGTNIHRFGDSEKVPFLRSPTRVPLPVSLNCDTADEILSVLLSAAIEMDRVLSELNIGYARKSDVLDSLILYFLKL